MTSEEAKEILLRPFYMANVPCDVVKAHIMAIEALEWQTNGRFVTKGVIRKQMLKYGFYAPDMTVTEFVEDLPSVIPQPKIGRWIRWHEQREMEKGCLEYIPHCQCSECGKKYDSHSSKFIKYCPICGAKMEDVEE